MKIIDVTDEAQQKRVLQMICDSVFRNMALRVVIDAVPEQDTCGAGFVERLREIPSLDFAAKVTAAQKP